MLGREWMTAARGLSRAGSWIQASGAMVTVTIETHQLHSASLWGFVGVCHELEPIEKGTLKWVESEARAKSHFGAPPRTPFLHLHHLPLLLPTPPFMYCAVLGVVAAGCPCAFFTGPGLPTSSSYLFISAHLSSKYRTLITGTQTNKISGLMKLPI